MSKILFICDYYYPNATSIGVCTHKVAKALQQQGNEVHVLAFGEPNKPVSGEYEGIRCFTIKKRFHERCDDLGNKIGGIGGTLLRALGKAKCRLWQLLWFPFFRMDGLRVPLRYYRAMSKLYREYGYDMIVATYNPFEGMLASYWFKKRHPHTLFALYILDTLTNAGRTSFISAECNDKMGWRWENRIFPHCDQIINLRCHEEHHAQKRYDPFRGNMVFSDIPFLAENTAADDYFDVDHIHFVYTGRILKRLGSCAYTLSLFDSIGEENPYILHCFSAGDEEDLIKTYERKSGGRVIGHGLVPHAQVALIQHSADVLVSIGNAQGDKITSKIFEYISTGKRIIHFSKTEVDAAVPYYEQYGNALILRESDPVWHNIEKLERFLSVPYARIAFDKIKSSFPENLPEHTADLIAARLCDGAKSIENGKIGR